MKTWTMRLTGTLNMLFMAAGFYYFVMSLSRKSHEWPGMPSRMDWLLFLLLCTITVFLLARLGYLGLRLLRGDERAILATGIVFIAEILYFLADLILFWIVIPNPALTVGFFGIARTPLDPQVVTGYPLIGGAAMFVLWRLRKLPVG